MSHAFKAEQGTTFHYNSDMSGSILVVDPSRKELYIPAQDILDFVANYVRHQMIAAAEQMTTNMILFGGDSRDTLPGDGR